jgi:hypothetical protein
MLGRRGGQECLRSAVRDARAIGRRGHDCHAIDAISGSREELCQRVLVPLQQASRVISTGFDANIQAVLFEREADRDCPEIGRLQLEAKDLDDGVAACTPVGRASSRRMAPAAATIWPATWCVGSGAAPGACGGSFDTLETA